MDDFDSATTRNRQQTVGIDVAIKNTAKGSPRTHPRNFGVNAKRTKFVEQVPWLAEDGGQRRPMMGEASRQIEHLPLLTIDIAATRKK
jgi:hypothetical protein